ncbi:hypothetical protein PVAP13_1NG170195 [Panicum virgatum]|uniref:Uncharacterized protein n=1 Tax=Panicum virgatum TaxID=38727 RepID=A0A8T0WTW3_PANVG|nr:hypothetical protein PVAP13_1NG170195 [Panicum virgatum]
MDVLCSDKTGTLTINKLSVDRSLVEIFAAGVEKDDVVLFAARASRLENQDAINAAMVSMLDDPKEAREGIEEVHFLPFNPVDKRTAPRTLTLRMVAGTVSARALPSRNLVHTVIDKYAERGLRSLAVARQCQRRAKKALESLGSLLACSLCLTHPGQTVLTLSSMLSTLGSM